MKGRHSAKLLRQIDDIIQYAENNNKQGYILAVDYKKCFDSVSHSYIDYAFKSFGFGINFTRWVQLLTRNGKSCVNNGGWLTKFYNLEQGLKQGCPCSPLTYLVVAELLSLKTKQNKWLKY